MLTERGAVGSGAKPTPADVQIPILLDLLGIDMAHSQNWKEISMPQKLEGKIAFVTGGSRGIGAAIARRLAADGARVAISYATGAGAADSVVKTIERVGGEAIAIRADAADADALKAAVETVVATFGRIDV